MLMLTVNDIYWQRATTPSDIVEHLEYIYDTVVNSHAQVVVELGVRSGNSTAALLAAVEHTGGHLYSIDISIPEWPLEFYHSKHSTLIIADDLTVAGQMPDEIDVLFIDTSHHYGQTLAELRLYGSRSNVILLHDTMLEHPYQTPDTDPPYPVKTAVEDWCAEAGRTWSNRENCWGLGVIGPKEA
jgi:predicted O-methyltransferase YrrM